MNSDNANPVSIGIVGGTGYTGAELLRLLVAHPGARVVAVTSREQAGTPVAAAYPQLRGHSRLDFVAPSAAALADCELIFCATPHAAAMHLVPQLLDAGQKVIDLSADFRLRDPALWARWYGQAHACPALIAQAVYGLPERHRDAIRGARLIACPGCYPTAVVLGLLPLLEAGVVVPDGIIASAVTGVSGAGRSLKTPFLFGEMSESFKAYAVAGHRHAPEIDQVLTDVAGAPVGFTFVPHLAPMVRGIHASLYGRLASGGHDLQDLFERRYAGEPFVDVMPAGSMPETRSVRGANVCRIAVHRPGDGDTVVVLAVIDNLMKGAAGQAVQCFNLQCGFDETTGLTAPALVP